MASRVFSYVIAHDLGFAPNPFGAFLTLACCKPLIRRTAAPGDWVVGLTPWSERIAYAMRVTERLDFAEYWLDPRFRGKRLDMGSPDRRRRSGDNIYRPLAEGGFRQVPSGHSRRDGTEHPGMKRRDSPVLSSHS